MARDRKTYVYTASPKERRCPRALGVNIINLCKINGKRIVGPIRLIEANTGV